MGFTCPLEWLGIVRYRAVFENGLTDHELVHVFRGIYDGPVVPNPAEADGYQWCDLAGVHKDIAASPERFSVWFRQYIAEDWPMALAPPVLTRTGKRAP
jgi:isopentenyl-diphosphate delta-isomerase